MRLRTEGLARGEVTLRSWVMKSVSVVEADGSGVMEEGLGGGGGGGGSEGVRGKGVRRLRGQPKGIAYYYYYRHLIDASLPTFLHRTSHYHLHLPIPLLHPPSLLLLLLLLLLLVRSAASLTICVWVTKPSLIRLLFYLAAAIACPICTSSFSSSSYSSSYTFFLPFLQLRPPPLLPPTPAFRFSICAFSLALSLHSDTHLLLRLCYEGRWKESRGKA
ncbi:hypothetical protein E2C01_076446 [Portunus trituberculatus]|uniref:Uncharacterized protein n=1 Tax=Portunus trituberculatus TaxID=210409 RepID=A0A5B7I8R6_PORTR|nr:hypothetical protein [Portunus trituberculatus]